MESRPAYLTTDEVMSLLRITSKQTLRRYEVGTPGLDDGLPFHQLTPGGKKLYRRADVERWIDSRWNERAAGKTA